MAKSKVTYKPNSDMRYNELPLKGSIDSMISYNQPTAMLCSGSGIASHIQLDRHLT